MLIAITYLLKVGGKVFSQAVRVQRKSIKGEIVHAGENKTAFTCIDNGNQDLEAYMHKDFIQAEKVRAIIHPQYPKNSYTNIGIDLQLNHWKEVPIEEWTILDKRTPVSNLSFIN